ncbi:hypothetical protein [Streptomyces sp. NPDC051569]|uniref:hypothetical protein n=1 Tax=Streptomyces sp. NPDC051569 TaxID=3365661 RepID=UPI0037A62AED
MPPACAASGSPRSASRSGAALAGGVLSAVVLGGLLAAAPGAAAAADVTCSANVYKRTFYKNTSFSGSPVRTDCDKAISRSWSGRPVAGVPSDNFGVRWSVTRDFGIEGPFTFTAAATATADVRVYLDGVQVDRPVEEHRQHRPLQGRQPHRPLRQAHPARRLRELDRRAAKVKFTYRPRTSATYDKRKPLAPGVKTAYNTKVRKATVSWSANKEMDLAGYSLYRRPVDSGTWTKVAATTARSYTDPLVNPDDRTPYYYEVRARDKADNTSSGSADIIVRPLPVVTFLPPASPCAPARRASRPPRPTTRRP